MELLHCLQFSEGGIPCIASRVRDSINLGLFDNKSLAIRAEKCTMREPLLLRRYGMVTSMADDLSISPEPTKQQLAIKGAPSSPRFPSERKGFFGSKPGQQTLL
uniref:Uncharacterized protein n=1 Tax=Coccidioides posadasii RMSCC 3488 TaxID=454284 RepID=A0A0J6I2S1_COCPO|nr:hypothetical protein CPAG_01968 [Coccidioides posadasii RMSCC 3488]